MVQMIRRAVSRYSKGIVLLCIAVTVLYTMAVLLLSLLERPVPDSLTYCLFGMYGVELASCAAITVKKVKAGAETPRIPEGEEDGNSEEVDQ